MAIFDPGFLPLFWGLGFFSPVVASACAVLFYTRHCRAFPDRQARISLVAYVLTLLVCAIIAFFIGLQYGLTWACSSRWGGNLCGLVGFFIVGPVAAALAIFFVSTSLMLLRGEARPRGTVSELSSIYLRLWRGQYPLAHAIWGFFVSGTCIVWLVGILSGFLFISHPSTLVIYRVLFLGYLITAAVGVWRSANALARAQRSSPSADWLRIIAAKAAVVIVTLFFAIGGYIEAAWHYLHMAG